jgi:hypothetical protein
MRRLDNYIIATGSNSRVFAEWAMNVTKEGGTRSPYCIWPYDEMPHLGRNPGPVIGRLPPFAVNRHATFGPRVIHDNHY